MNKTVEIIDYASKKERHACDKTCRYFSMAFAHNTKACALSDVYSVNQGDLCSTYDRLIPISLTINDQEILLSLNCTDKNTTFVNQSNIIDQIKTSLNKKYLAGFVDLQKESHSETVYWEIS